MNPTLSLISTVIGLFSFACMVGAVIVRRWVTPYLRELMKVSVDTKKEVTETKKEVTSNGGNSIKDVVDRIAVEQHEILSKQEEHARSLLLLHEGRTDLSMQMKAITRDHTKLVKELPEMIRTTIVETQGESDA